MERINVRVDERVKQELEAEAKEKGVSPSEVVREVLDEHLKARPKQESCLDIAQRIGIVGVYTNAPRDLSTNKSYFDGFGRD